MDGRNPRGRGSGIDPTNRFTRIELQLDGDEIDHRHRAGDESDAAATRFLRDTSRRVISTNDSPDIGFDASLNPYRGCEHGCSYCLDGGTLILTARGDQVPLRNVRPGDAIMGTARDGRYRKLVTTVVGDAWKTIRHAYRVTLRDGTTLLASADHRFLTWRGWKHVVGSTSGRLRRPHLTPNDTLLGIGREDGAPEAHGHAFAHRHALKRTRRLQVAMVEDCRVDREMFDITTGTGDFIANGVVSHNCYARPTHEYLGLSAGLDFERVIMVKEDAPELLASELAARSWRPKTLALSGVTDPYQPVERRLEITRRCLQVLAAHRNPVSVITKNAMVLRDVDVLLELASFSAARVTISITTLDEDLRRVLEPRTSTASRRLAAVHALAEAGVPVGVNVAPIIPGLNDHEVPAILAAAAEAGAQGASCTVLRLPGAVAEVFADWLHRHRPERAERVLARVRDARGGKLNDARFGHRMRGDGPYAEGIRQLFEVQRRRVGLERDLAPLDASGFRVPGRASQGGLFGDEAGGGAPGCYEDDGGVTARR